MSNGKRFALPTQKGTELFPKIMQSPVKLVIKDVPPHSPLYSAVVSKFSGQLKVFHAKAQQAYALSNNPIGRARYNWGPARATYTNIQGQEILELEVAVPVLLQIIEELKEQPTVQPKSSRDLIIISFEYADMWGLSATHSAYQLIPKLFGQLPETSFTATHGLALEGGRDDGSPHPIVAFPSIIPGHARYESPFVEIPADGTQRSTLLWDLSEFGDMSVCVVDVYALMTGSGPESCQLTGWFWDPDLSGIVLSQTFTLWHEWQELVSVVFQSGSFSEADKFIPPDADEWAAEIPSSEIYYTPSDIPLTNSLTPDQVPDDWDGKVFSYSSSWTDADIDTYAAEGMAHYTGEPYQHLVPYGTAMGNYQWHEVVRTDTVSEYSWHKVYNRTFDPDFSTTRDVKVSATFVDGANLGISHTSGIKIIDDGTPCEPYGQAQNFYGWELQDIYPKRPETLLGHTTATTVSDVDFTMAHHFGQQFLCRITYDREHDALSMTNKI